MVAGRPGSALSNLVEYIHGLLLADAEFDLPAIQSFFKDAIDYVGLSAYIPQSSIRFEVFTRYGID